MRQKKLQLQTTTALPKQFDVDAICEEKSCVNGKRKGKKERVLNLEDTFISGNYFLGVMFWGESSLV